MFRNFSNSALSVSGRHSEIIELALTYGYDGMDLDLADFGKRVEVRGQDHSARFLVSAKRRFKLRIGGGALPVRIFGTEAEYRLDLSRLQPITDAARAIEADRFWVFAQPVNDGMSFQENFERHRTRLTEVGEKLGEAEMKLAVAFQADNSKRPDDASPFLSKTEELISLVKAIPARNVGVMLDTWHWWVGGGSMDQIRELDGDRIVMVRLADVPGGVDLSKVDFRARLLPGADGVVDAVEILKILQEKGYDGPVTPYPHSSQFRGMTRENIVAETTMAFDRVWGDAGLPMPEHSFLHAPQPSYYQAEQAAAPEEAAAEGAEADGAAASE